MKSVDVLVAVRNEEKSIPVFIKKFNKLAPPDVIIRLIFIEDGSTDNTVSVLKDLAAGSENVEYVSLKNKYGQYAALIWGMRISEADAVITMDVDGGHPIETAIEMIRNFLNGDNVVQGQRIFYKRKKFYRTIMSYTYNLIFYLIVGVNLFHQNVMFRLLDKSTREIFLKNKKWWHIFKTNFRINDRINSSYIRYEAPERDIGESKYNFFRLLKLSCKSFFSLLPLYRLVFINIILIALIILFYYKEIFILSIISVIIFLVINISYFVIVNHYPIPLIKIIETSLPEFK